MKGRSVEEDGVRERGTEQGERVTERADGYKAVGGKME